MFSVTKHSLYADTSVDVFIIHKTCLLPSGPNSTTDVRISGARPRRAQGSRLQAFILDSVSHLNFIVFGAFPSLACDYWLDEYFHLRDLRAPHTLHVKTLTDVPSRADLPPIFSFSLRLEARDCPWLFASRKSEVSSFDLLDASLLSIPGAQVFSPLTWTGVSTCRATSTSPWMGLPGLPSTAKCRFYLFSAQSPSVTLHCSLMAFITCLSRPFV